MSEADPAFPVPAIHPPALAELQSLLGFHISLANTAIKAHFQAHSSSLGITQKQIAILWLVDGCPDIVQVDLAKMLRVKRATMWAMIGTLCTRNLLERRGAGGADARHVTLKLTDAGRKVLRQARRSIERHEAWVRQCLSPEQQRAVVDLMTRIHDRKD